MRTSGKIPLEVGIIDLSHSSQEAELIAIEMDVEWRDASRRW